MAFQKLAGTEAVLRKFIERNRDKIENYIANDPTITIDTDGLVCINFKAFADPQAVSDLLGEVKTRG